MTNNKILINREQVIFDFKKSVQISEAELLKPHGTSGEIAKKVKLCNYCSGYIYCCLNHVLNYQFIY